MQEEIRYNKKWASDGRTAIQSKHPHFKICHQSVSSFSTCCKRSLACCTSLLIYAFRRLSHVMSQTLEWVRIKLYFWAHRIAVPERQMCQSILLKRWVESLLCVYMQGKKRLTCPLLKPEKEDITNIWERLEGTNRDRLCVWRTSGSIKDYRFVPVIEQLDSHLKKCWKGWNFTSLDNLLLKAHINSARDKSFLKPKLNSFFLALYVAVEQANQISMFHGFK